MVELNPINNTARSYRQDFRSLPLWLSAFVVLFLIPILLSGCAVKKETPRELTPITDAPTSVYQPGKWVWNDLLTDDAAKAKEFYGQLFGWTFEDLVGYTVVKNNGQSIGGIAQVDQSSDNAGVSRWLCALSVDDVDKAADFITGAGGTVNIGPVDMENRGRGAIVRDPQGAQLLLIRSLHGDPEDGELVMGSWLWHELWSNKPEASLEFYQALAGYEFLGEMDDYLILLKDDHWRAGIRYVDDSELEMRWVPVVRVEDTDDVAARAETLSGEVLVGPRPIETGSVALLSDPSGALFIIQRWTEQYPEQEQ